MYGGLIFLHMKQNMKSAGKNVELAREGWSMKLKKIYTRKIIDSEKGAREDWPNISDG